MAAPTNEQRAQQWHREVIQEGKFDRADHLFTPDAVVHVNGQQFQGLEAIKGLARALQTAAPQIAITHHETLAAENRVAIRWSAVGTHRGDYFGIPASNRPITFDGIDWFHFAGDRIAELWIAFDNLGVTQQMTEGGGSRSTTSA